MTTQTHSHIEKFLEKLRKEGKISESLYSNLSDKLCRSLKKSSMEEMGKTLGELVSQLSDYERVDGYDRLKFLSELIPNFRRNLNKVADDVFASCKEIFEEYKVTSIKKEDFEKTRKDVSEVINNFRFAERSGSGDASFYFNSRFFLDSLWMNSDCWIIMVVHETVHYITDLFLDKEDDYRASLNAQVHEMDLRAELALHNLKEQFEKDRIKRFEKELQHMVKQAFENGKTDHLFDDIHVFCSLKSKKNKLLFTYLFVFGIKQILNQFSQGGMVSSFLKNRRMSLFSEGYTDLLTMKIVNKWGVRTETFLRTSGYAGELNALLAHSKKDVDETIRKMMLQAQKRKLITGSFGLIFEQIIRYLEHVSAKHKMICPVCKSEISKSQLYCYNCGLAPRGSRDIHLRF